MSIRNLVLALVITAASFVSISAQRPELTVSFNEQFFDALLDSVFENAGPVEFPLARNEVPRPERSSGALAFAPGTSACDETVKILRENNGVRTAVRFREGKIYAPLAFTGNYSPPFIGCVGFGGWAETNIDLEFEPATQRLVARARVLNVSLNGTGGVGGTVIARMIQGSIDKKINPIEIIRLDKLAFALPVRTTSLKMRAVGIRHDVSAGSLNVRVAYEFVKN